MTIPSTITKRADEVELGEVIVTTDGNHVWAERVEGWFWDARPGRIVLQYGGVNHIHRSSERLQVQQ